MLRSIELHAKILLAKDIMVPVFLTSVLQRDFMFQWFSVFTAFYLNSALCHYGKVKSNYFIVRPKVDHRAGLLN